MNLKNKNFFIDILNQFLNYAKAKEPLNETESELDSDFFSQPLNSLVNKIQILLEKVDSDDLELNYIENSI